MSGEPRFEFHPNEEEPDEDYEAFLGAQIQADAERDARIAEKVSTLLAAVVPLTHYDAGSFWVEIESDQTAWLATQLSHTAIAHYYANELHQEEGEHVRRWFFLVAEKEGKPFAPVCLCVVPEGATVISRMTAACHTVGFANAPAYPDYADQIAHLATITGLPIFPNYAGTPISA